MVSTQITAERYHDISCGHRVHGHESKCSLIHGHNYRITFTCTSTQLDRVGRVVDFSVMKTLFCGWLEDTWDHKFLAWKDDPIIACLLSGGAYDIQEKHPFSKYTEILRNSIVLVPFNPTAENMAKYLLEVICPRLLGEDMDDRGFEVTRVVVEETRKCRATAELE